MSIRNFLSLPKVAEYVLRNSLYRSHNLRSNETSTLFKIICCIKIVLLKQIVYLCVKQKIYYGAGSIDQQ
jgi:hypothetical protein